jgi:hypothetical protein
LREIFTNEIRSLLHAKRVREITSAADTSFGTVDDIIREAALMATGRRLSGEAIIERCRAGLREIFA